jgi:hypothetical protein
MYSSWEVDSDQKVTSATYEFFVNENALSTAAVTLAHFAEGDNAFPNKEAYLTEAKNSQAISGVP